MGLNVGLNGGNGSQGVNINAFKATFDKTTNSYKFIFAIALTNILEERGFGEAIISFDVITTEMLVLAWYPHKMGLSLGKQDKLGDVLDNLQSLSSTNSEVEFMKYLKAGVLIDYPLDRYVPYRILRGFFIEELRGIPDSAVNKRIVELADENFEEVKPVYRFIDKNTIEIHPSWMDYFRVHSESMKEFVLREWVKYLESRNPDVASIREKMAVILDCN